MMKKLLAAAAMVAALGMAGAASATTYVYVGSWNVADGPLWSGPDVPGNDPVFSGVDAAAYLFGGSASDYVTSTMGPDPLLIDFSAWVDMYGDTSHLVGGTPVADTFKVVSGSDYQSGPPASSAYIFDHACGVYYCADGGGERSTNYAFKVAGVPEPGSWALMIGGLGLAGASLRRRRQLAVVA